MRGRGHYDKDIHGGGEEGGLDGNSSWREEGCKPFMGEKIEKKDGKFIGGGGGGVLGRT